MTHSNHAGVTVRTVTTSPVSSLDLRESNGASTALLTRGRTL